MLFKQLDLRNDELNRQKGFELSAGENRFEFNPVTGQYEQVAGLPGEEKFAPGDIGEYQRLFGKNPTPEELLNFTSQKAAATRKPGDGEPKTETERRAAAVAKFSNVFIRGAKYEGTEVIGGDGYMDPRAWRAAIADAPSEGLTRKNFIEEFGYLINPDTKKNKAIGKTPMQEYGLTSAELKLIGIEL